MSTLDPLFNPRTVAVLGASFETSGRAYGYIRALVDGGYGGEVIPVHSTDVEVCGRRAVPQLKDVKRDIDVVVAAVPPQDAVAAVREAAAVRARSVILPHGCGVAPASAAAQKARREALSVARAAHTRLLGPRAAGVADPQMGMSLCGLPDLPRERGGISLIAPEPAYFLLLAAELRSRGRGFARAIAYGEQLDVDAADALEFLGKDARTEAILLVLDEIRDGQKFLAVASEVALQKPVVALHVRPGPRDARDFYATAFRQCGLIAAEDLEELFDLGLALSASQRNLPANETAGVAVLPAGLSLLAHSACARAGLSMASWDAKTTRALKGVVGEVKSPVAVPEHLPANRFASCFDALLSDTRASGLLLLNVGGDSPEMAEAVVEARRRTGKPIVAMTVGAPTAAVALLDGGVPGYPTPERAARAYAGLLRYRRLLEVQKRKGILARPKAPPAEAAPDGAGRTREMREPDVLGVLKGAGLAVPEGVVLESLKTANASLKKVGYPATLRALPARKVSTKKEPGLTIEGVRNRRELERGFLLLRKKFHRCPVFIGAAAPEGSAVPLGVRRDPVFGAVLTVEGPAGAVSRLCPLGRTEAEMLLSEAGLAPEGKAHPGLVDLLVRLCHAACEKAGLQEVFLRPRITARGALWVGDARGLSVEQ